MQLQPAMKKHIFHLAWSPESLPTVDAISPLLDFLEARLQDFNGRFLRGNVIRCSTCQKQLYKNDKMISKPSQSGKHFN